MKGKDLLKLAAYLREFVPRKAFDMVCWGQKGVGPFGRDIMKARRNDFECGMKACIGGHAAARFPRRLKLTVEEDGVSELTHRFSGLRGTYAFQHAFRICLDHADAITQESSRHQTPKAAASFIERFVEKNPECPDGPRCSRYSNY